MTDLVALARFGELVSEGYIPSVGSWVQVVPGDGLTTRLNAFNTLGEQSIEMYIFDRAGDRVAPVKTYTVPTSTALRLDLEDIIDASALPFEGSLWIWAKGATDEGAIGLQSIDMDFIDRAQPEGHTLGTVHLMFDFINTLGLPPFLDLVSPRVLIEKTPEGAPRYQNYLGLAHIPLNAGDYSGPKLDISVSNEAGETIRASNQVTIPTLGSWFGSLEALIPELTDFLLPEGTTRGRGVVNVRELDSRQTGLACMIKVQDMVSGQLLVDHLNDRNFARAAMKDG
jgi:hypothetical protein